MKHHILVVEDDETLQALLAFYLTKENHSVSCAGSADEMREHLGKRAYDLILLDLGLPDADGLVLLRELRTEGDMPVVVLTGDRGQDALVSALEAGAADYLKKPFDPRELTLRVNRVLTQLRLEKQLIELATTDGLTGLSNRRAFDERLEQDWRRAERIGGSLALALLDVDYFKRYNDHLGHSGGDECLRRVADVLNDGRRVSDLAARIGGEEFCLILPDADWGGALAVAEAIRSGVESLQIEHPGSPLGIVTVSIGVAASEPRMIGSATGVFKAADQALYRAKAGGRNRVAEAMQSSMLGAG